MFQRKLALVLVLSSSKTSVLARAIWRNIPEYAILHSHCRENLKSYMFFLFVTDSFALLILELRKKKKNLRTYTHFKKLMLLAASRVITKQFFLLFDITVCILSAKVAYQISEITEVPLCHCYSFSLQRNRIYRDGKIPDNWKFKMATRGCKSKGQYI
jgi:presenilin-like A22 family membrane protease